MYLMISQFIHSKLEEVDSICDTKLNKTYYDQFYKKQTNIRDMYKQCPNCK